ncbi:hypothetical protein [Staphylococcus caledonicus]|uniref:hypothetical protein n=1 Tax=Staphylococcus caledonicus TaxID=2741333 RepID=UPI0018E444E5|nr:hypothetical protein [Staphylococcus caledonicus]MBI5973908.1 hypothetical protein [Staphylococcus caledonicus]
MDNAQIICLLEDEDIELTKNIEEAIYIMSDGRYISGMFDSGIRGIDHRVIESLFDDIDRETEGFWDKALNRLSLVMYVPETNTVLLKDNQKVTDKQLEVIENLKEDNHKVESF